jgi:hypothetical protein
MTGLWTNDRDRLARALFAEFDHARIWDNLTARGRRRWAKHADSLIAEGVVWVLDPDDTELRGRLAKRLREIEDLEVAASTAADTDWAAGQLIEALRQP